MPAVPLFIYGIGSFLAGTFGIVAGWTAGLALGAAALTLTVAGARRASKTLQDPGDIQQSAGQSVMVRSTQLPRNIVFGETQVGGILTYCNSAGTDLRSLYYEIVHTGHEIDSFVGWYIDDKYIPAADVDNILGGGDGSVDSDTGGHGLDPSAGGVTLYLRGHLGTDSQAVDSMLDSAFVDITSAHRHRGCARTNVRCELVVGYEDKWNGRSPRSITAVMRGAKCYDPRADSTFPGGSGAQRLATPSTWGWTDNPALIWARYRTMPYPLGPGWDTARINWQSVFDAAAACDVSVAIPTSTTEKRFRCDLVVDTSMEPTAVIEKILASMYGREAQVNGLWNVYAGTWPTPDFALTEADLIGEYNYRKQPEGDDRYNQVKGSFIDRARVFKPVQFVTVNNTSLRTARDNSRTLPKALALDGVSREYQAQRVALRWLNQADDTGILIFPTGYNGMRIKVGDTGTVTISELGFNAKSFRCIRMRHIPFVGFELALKEDESGNYSDPLEGAYSTRTAAGEIVFGTVMPWYLRKAPAQMWMPDSEGKPAGIRGVGNITDRSQLFLTDGRLRITSTPDTTVIYGFPAIPINDGKQYQLTIRHRSSAASSDGLYLIFYERSSALTVGMTHIGGGSGMEPIVDSATSSQSPVSNGPMPGTTMIEQAYVYTPTSGTKFATFAMGNFDPATASTEYVVEWVALTELGTNINVLPGLIAQTDTVGLVPNSITDVYVAEADGPFTVAASAGGSDTEVMVTLSFTVAYDCEIQAWIDGVIENSNVAVAGDVIGCRVQYQLNGGGYTLLIKERPVAEATFPTPFSFTTGTFSASAGDDVDIRLVAVADSEATGSAAGDFTDPAVTALVKKK